MARRLSLGFPLLIAAFVGCGGTGEKRPSDEPTKAPPDAGPPSSCDVLEDYEYLTIADFETTNNIGQVHCDPGVFVSSSARGSCFFFNYDAANSWGPMGCENTDRPGQKADVISPGAGENIYANPIDARECATPSNGLHVLAKNIALCYAPNGRLGWGISLEILLTPSSQLPPTDPGAGGAGGATGAGGEGGAGGSSGMPPGVFGFDASQWDGISFWVKKGPEATGPAIIVTAADPATGGDPYCSIADGVPDAEKCDAFGVAVTLDSEWTLIRAPFSALRQKGFGVASPFGEIDSGNIKRLNVLASAGDWDFWIDDLSFYRALR